MEALRTIVESFERSDFHKKFVHNIITDSDFSAFVVDPVGTSRTSKQKITHLLVSAGIPKDAIATDSDLHLATSLIMDRAVHLR